MGDVIIICIRGGLTMQKSDSIYLSRFALDPDPEQSWLEDLDLGNEPEIEKIADEIFFEDENGFLNRVKTIRTI